MTEPPAETLEELIRLTFYRPIWGGKDEVHTLYGEGVDYSLLMTPELRAKVIALLKKEEDER